MTTSNTDSAAGTKTNECVTESTKSSLITLRRDVMTMCLLNYVTMGLKGILLLKNNGKS